MGVVAVGAFGEDEHAGLVTSREVIVDLRVDPRSPQGIESVDTDNENYPGVWRCTVRRIEERAGGVVTVTEIGDARTALFAVSFFRVRDGRIVAAEEYFAENGSPPFDRSAWTERYSVAVD